MTRTIQFKRRSAQSLANTVGANGELIIDMTNKTLTIHDGVSYGGTRLASEEYVANTMIDLVGGSPEALDTIIELADAINNDPNFFTNIQNTIVTANSDMKVYVDDQVSQLAANTLNMDSMVAANTWLQSNDAITLTESKTYTDTSVNNLKSYTDDHLNTKANTNGLSNVAFTGSYSDLSGTPTDLSTFNNDVGYITQSNLVGYASETYVNNEVANLVNSAPETLNTLNELAGALGNDENFSTSVANLIGQKANTTDLSTVATSGNYNDLTNKPTLFSGEYNDLNNKPQLFSGSYNDLLDKPIIPTIPVNVSDFQNDAGYLTSYTETDPVFTSWDKSTGITITESQISDLKNYLTSYTETDPIFTTSPASSITNENISAWNSAAGGGVTQEYVDVVLSLKANTSDLGTAAYTNTTDYATSAQGAKADTALQSETDPVFTSWDKSTGITITESQISDLKNYLTSYIETDPVFLSSEAANITSQNTIDWNTAYSWGNHATQGYATETYVNNAVSNLVDSAPEALNTLNELAGALGNDPNLSTTLLTQIGQKANTSDLGTAAYTNTTDYATSAQGTKADTALQPSDIGTNVQSFNANTVVDGLYVHTDNNYTTTEKDKLAGISEGAEVNVNADWNAVEGDAQILNKPILSNVAISGSYSDLSGVPTNISQFANDSGYLTSYTETDPVFTSSPANNITSTQITNWDTSYTWGNHAAQGYATKTYVNNAVSGLVDSAPATLDTLNELAAALGNDANFATTVTNMVGTAKNTANDAFNRANTAINNASSASLYANTAINNAASASLYANTGINNATSASSYANTGITLAQAAFNQANTANNNAASASFYANNVLNSPTFTGTVTLPIVSEPLSSISGATGTVTHNLNTSTIFYHTSVAGDFTANIINVPTTPNRVISVSIIIAQGSSPYIPIGLQINGSTMTIKWADGSIPIGNANSIDVVGFSLINIGGTWSVIGVLSKFA